MLCTGYLGECIVSYNCPSSSMMELRQRLQITVVVSKEDGVMVPVIYTCQSATGRISVSFWSVEGGCSQTPFSQV